MLLTVNKLNDRITGIAGNDRYSIPFDAVKYDALLQLEKQFSNVASFAEAQAVVDEAKKVAEDKSAITIIQSICPYLTLDTKTNKFHLTMNGVVSKIALPKVLADRIIESVEKEIAFEPLVKAWLWFLRNPQFTPQKAELFATYLTTTVVDEDEKKRLIEEEGYSPEKATELATYNDVSITNNGFLVTYKYAQIKYKRYDSATGELVDRYDVSYDTETGNATVNLPKEAEDYYLIPPIKGEGGDAFYAGEALGHRIKVGDIHRLPNWSFVNCDDRQSCVKGLHLGGLRYIKGYGGHGRLLLNAFVNPMHIGAFDHSGNGAVRVLEYFVHSAQFAPNKGMYFESNYAAHSEAQWKELASEAIKKSEEAIAKLKEYQTQISAF